MPPSTTSTGRQAKKPFQPSLHSFWGHGTPSTSTPSAPSLSPSLPAPVQSSLLNVGMRVRKSVPSGYQTTKTLKTFSQHSPLPEDEMRMELSSPSPAPPNVIPRAGLTELTPFCGILKVGGLDVQQPQSQAQREGFFDEGYVSLPSSQESAYNANKRRRGDQGNDEEDDEVPLPSIRSSSQQQQQQQQRIYAPFSFHLDDTDAGDFDEEMPISPRSIPVSPPTSTSWTGGSLNGALGRLQQRVFATPKSRRKRDAEMMGDQENQCAGQRSSSDFGEAEFLVRDGEVEMGGL